MSAPLSREAWDAVARALDYPGPGSSEEARRAARLSSAAPALSGALEDLAAHLESAAPGEAEERYTSLFDLSPVCTLHAGWHLLGESYERGALLAGLAGELRAAQVDPGVELPDFLPTLLRLLGALGEGEMRETLVDDVLRPALGRMSAALAESPAAWARVVRSLAGAVAPLGTGRSSALEAAVAAYAPPPCASVEEVEARA